MAYSYGSPYGSQDQYPSVGHDGYWAQFTGATHQRASSGNQWTWAVLLLGLATYVVSYAAVTQPGSTGWGVRFSTLAAIVAALGLLPRQDTHTKLVVALAVMGFLEALSWWITDDQNPHWTALVTVVVTGLQSVTAITALLAQLRAPDTPDREPGPYDDAYANYAQAVQQYYAANAQQPQQQPAQGQATVRAEAAAPALAEQSAEERYALYAEYLDAQRSGRNPVMPSPQSSGQTQTAQPTAGTGTPTTGPAGTVRPGTDPVTGLPTQFPSS